MSPISLINKDLPLKPSTRDTRLLGLIFGTMLGLMNVGAALPAGMMILTVGMLGISVGILLLFAIYYWRTVLKIQLSMLPLLLFMLILVFWSVIVQVAHQSGGFTLRNEILTLIIVLVLIFALRVSDEDSFMKGYGIVMMLGALGFIALQMQGNSLLRNTNTYTSLSLPPLFWLWRRGVFRPISLIAAVGAFSFAWIMQARSGAGLILIATVLYMLPFGPWVQRAMQVGVVSLVGFNLWFAANFNYAVNVALTNRLVVWEYYFSQITQHPFLGNGPLNSDVGYGAATAVAGHVGMYYGQNYFPHSIYLMYFYEYGIFALIAVVSLMLRGLRSAKPYAIPVFLYAIAAGFETARLGFPQVTGFPLTIFLIMAYQSQSRVMRARARPAEDGYPSGQAAQTAA